MFVFIVEPNAQASMSYFNKTWLEYVGLSFEQGLGTSWNTLIHPEDLQIIYDLYQAAFNERRAYTLPAIRVRKYTGEYRWHLFKGNPRFLSNGEFMGYVGVGIDIHEQKIIHEQLESKNDQLIKINNDLDNFIYTASHDLKAPMSNIEGLLISLRENMESEVEKVNEEADILLQLMEKSINRFKTTILDLTEITKVQKAQEEDIKEINFSQIVEDVKLSIYDKIVESGVNIETDFSAVNSVRFSKKNLKSIVYNLLSNGIKYRDKVKSAEVFIKTEKIENYIVLMFRDNGLGINEQNQGKMFTMFKRFHDHVEGTGVGLYIVKRIVDNAGGKIEVESEVGKGTTFKVYFKTM
jgi:PAS domain S-box-containing protein